MNATTGRAPATHSQPSPPRRTQRERSATTRAQLADATVDLLVERGWAAVTIAEVAARAGLTRGAFHHHYDSLAALFADALRRAYDQMRSGGTKEHGTPLDVRGLIDATWTVIGTPEFKAVLEAWLALANDPDLADEIGPVVTEFATLLRPDVLAPEVLSTPDQHDFYLMARETMLGLALGRATNSGSPLGHESRVLTLLRAQADQIAGSAEPASS